eukprot:768756-Hanusia_phi.AAC.1
MDLTGLQQTSAEVYHSFVDPVPLDLVCLTSASGLERPTLLLSLPFPSSSSPSPTSPFPSPTPLEWLLSLRRQLGTQAPIPQPAHLLSAPLSSQLLLPAPPLSSSPNLVNHL